MVPVIVTQPLLFRRWIAIWVPSCGGETVPLKRKIAPRAVRRTRLTFTLTFGATPTATIGLSTAGTFGSTTRYCVLIDNDRIGNVKLPSALVRWMSDAFWNP